MITPSSHPQFKMSQGIICSSPSLTFTPYVTDAWSFNRPIEQVTRQNIYDKDNYNLNYGFSLQLNIPLGKSPALCHEASRVNIDAQKLLIAKTQMEMELYRLKICGEQARLGVQFVGKYAISCEGIQVSIPPNQVLPHVHKIEVKSQK